MKRTLRCITMVLLAAGVAAPSAAAAQDQKHSLSANTPNAVREHLDEADDLVDSLLRWKHIVTTVGRDQVPPEAPKNTLISIPREDARRLNDLLGALPAGMPAAAAAAPRGDMGAHIMKAREIAKELMTPSGAGDGGLVTIDRTALMRLEIEIDAAQDLLPRDGSKTSR